MGPAIHKSPFEVRRTFIVKCPEAPDYPDVLFTLMRVLAATFTGVSFFVSHRGSLVRGGPEAQR